MQASACSGALPAMAGCGTTPHPLRVCTLLAPWELERTKPAVNHTTDEAGCLLMVTPAGPFNAYLETEQPPFLLLASCLNGLHSLPASGMAVLATGGSHWACGRPQPVQSFHGVALVPGRNDLGQSGTVSSLYEPEAIPVPWNADLVSGPLTGLQPHPPLPLVEVQPRGPSCSERSLCSVCLWSAFAWHCPRWRRTPPNRFNQMPHP